MLPFDFDYYKPTTLKEAVALYQSMDQEWKKANVYFGRDRINHAWKN